MKAEPSLRIRPVLSAATSPISNEISCFQATALGIAVVATLSSLFALVSLAERHRPPRRFPLASPSLTTSLPSFFPFLLLLPSFGEAETFSLLTYGDVKSHARQIADVTSRRLMPPWLPSQDSLRMEEDSHLTSEQIALVEKWVADGTPGRRSRSTPPRAEIRLWLAAWLPARSGSRSCFTFAIPASGSDVSLEFHFSSALEVFALRQSHQKFIPATSAWIHHANLLRTACSPHAAKKNLRAAVSRAWNCKSNPKPLTPTGISFSGNPAALPSSNLPALPCALIPATISSSTPIFSLPANPRRFSPPSLSISPTSPLQGFP